MEESIEAEPLPLQVFDITPDQLRHVLVHPEAIRQRQRSDSLLEKRWEFKRGKADDLISAARICRRIAESPGLAQPQRESQLRPLLAVSLENAELAWQYAVLQLSGGRPVTARMAKRALQDLHLPLVNVRPAAPRVRESKGELRRIVLGTMDELLGLITQKADHSPLQSSNAGTDYDYDYEEQQRECGGTRFERSTGRRVQRIFEGGKRKSPSPIGCRSACPGVRAAGDSRTAAATPLRPGYRAHRSRSQECEEVAVWRGVTFVKRLVP